MQLLLENNIPFVSVAISNAGKKIEIPNILVDTGSASTVIAADWLTTIGISPSAEDILYTIRGVGGVEIVFTRKVDLMEIGSRQIEKFEVEVGGMDYGFEINGILGMDFLINAGAIINLRSMTIEFAQD